MCYTDGMKKKLLILLPLLSLTLTACDGFNFLPNGGNIVPTSSAQKDLESSFINSLDGEVRYVTLNKTSITLLPGMTYGLKLDITKEGEAPDFSATWDVEWGSESSDIASINDKGVITAGFVGSTRVYGKVFSSIGAYCTVNVVKKELDSLEIRNARKTYVLGSEFKPSFKCIAKYKGEIEEEVTPNSIDYSGVNMEVKGEYTVNVSYTFEEVTKTTSYKVNVIDNPTYEAKNLSYTYNDLYQDRTYGWYNPSSGTIKGLVIPVYFTDSDTFFSAESTEIGTEITKEKIRTDLNTAFFGEAGEDGWNSVKSYYHKASNGKVNLTGTISNWYEPGKSYTYYDSGAKIDQLVRDAVAWYFESNPSEDMTTYDSDNNGVFDYLNIIYGCSDYDEEEDGLNKIPYYWGKISSSSSAIVPADGDNPAVKFHMWASYEELYRDFEQSPVDAHVYTHETGHTFGLDDYYDYENANDVRAIAGGTMMFHNTHQQDPFSTLALGWSKVIVPETSCVIELGDYQSSYQTILLSPNPESVDSPFDEYLLVELYAPIGLNKRDANYSWRGYYSKGAQEPGIRIWHVNAVIAEELSKGVYEFTSNPMTVNWSTTAFSNSTSENHGSVLGEDYYDYSLLFEIRNDKTITYRPTTKDKNCMFSDATLFHAGDVFTIADYASQFIEGTKLDNGKEFPWKITVENIESDGDGYKATINIEEV